MPELLFDIIQGLPAIKSPESTELIHGAQGKLDLEHAYIIAYA